MARNPLGIRRGANLLSTLPGQVKGPSPSAALKNFAKEVRISAAQVLNAAVDDTIKTVEKQSRSVKPLHTFTRGQRVSPPNLLQAAVIAFDHRPEIIAHAFSTYLIGKDTPVVTGDYREFFKLYVDGSEGTPAMIRFGVRVEIVNTAPYARMLEVGLNDKGKPFVVQVKPHIVERIATQAMRTKWGKTARIKFGFTKIPDPYILQTDFHKGRNNKPGKVKADRAKNMPINYPTIIVEY